MKTTSILRSDIENNKWTPRYAYIEDKLKHSSKARNLEDFLSSGPTNGIDARTYIKDGRNYIRISDMKRFFISYTDIKTIDMQSIPYKVKLVENDILISRKGTPGIAVVVTKNDIESIIGTEAILLRIKDAYDPYFIAAFMNSKGFYEQVINNLSGAVASGINHPTLKKLKILYDETLVQQISPCVKEAVQLHTEADVLLKEAQQLLYQCLNLDFSSIAKVNNYSVNIADFTDKDLWTPRFSYPKYVQSEELLSSKWAIAPLNSLVSIQRGSEPGSINYREYLDKHDDDIAFIRTSDLINHEVDIFPDFYIPKELHTSLNQDIQTGDILFSKDGKIGMSAMVTNSDRIIFASGISRMRILDTALHEQLTAEYIFLVLSLHETGWEQARRRTVIASTIPHLQEERLGELIIPIIESSNIKRITEIVNEVFRLKDKKKTLIAKVRQDIDNYYL